MFPIRLVAVGLTIAAIAGSAYAGIGRWGPSAGPGGGAITSLAIDPTNPQIVFAASFRGGVFKSVDGGRSWRATVLKVRWVDALAIDPANPQVVYAGAFYGGVFKSVDAGASWRAVLSDRAVESLALNPRNPLVIYAGTDRDNRDHPNSFWVSEDGGRRWHVEAAEPESVGAIAIDSMHPKTIYAGGGEDCDAFKSTNGGRSWSVMNWPHCVAVFAIDPTHPSTVSAAGDSFGKTVDGGRRWKTIGLKKQQVTTIALDPHDTEVVYAGTAGGGVFKSTDGGRRWHTFSQGLTTHEVTVLAIDGTGNHLFAGTGDSSGGGGGRGVFDFSYPG
jgi:photosystem II stability/assembly factor-like uncharacterized protein